METLNVKLNAIVKRQFNHNTGKRVERCINNALNVDLNEACKVTSIVYTLQGRPLSLTTHTGATSTAIHYLEGIAGIRVQYVK